MKKYLLALIPLACLGIADAEAIPITYTADLLGSLEDPPNASPGTGFASIVFDADALTMQVDASFQDLLSDVIAAHIHCCTAVPFAGNVGVATQVPTFIGFPTGTSGTYSRFFDMSDAASWNPSFISANGGTPQSATAALALGLAAGSAYFNIHTVEFGGGEIRGFLRPQATPEPSTMGLLAAMGLGALALARRKRRA
ncbi:MAG: CHRD domain-containing protein [Vicinamibacteria bacterium]